MLILEALEQRLAMALVAAFDFDQGSGVTAIDASGNGNHGALGGATWTPNGRFGGAVSFDGINDWVTVADAASLDLTAGMTLEAWVQPTTINGWETVVLKEAGSELAYAMYGDNNGNDSGGPRRPGAWIRQGGASYSTLGSQQLAVGQWTHLAATYDGAALRLYLNGTLASSLSRTGAITVSTGPLRIGGNASWSEWFNGLIDEVRVYNHALTPEEIQSDMASPISGPDTTPPTINSRSPAAGATGVGSLSNITATFSEPIDPTSIGSDTMQLRSSDGTVIAAIVAYDSATRTATLDPATSLLPGATYSVTVRGGGLEPRVKDLAGNALASDASWEFTVAPLSLSISDATILEGNSGTATASLQVTLSAASSQPVVVTYATSFGTADETDYVAVLPTVLTFEPGQTSLPISVAVIGDLLGEPNETLQVVLSNPSGAVLADGSGGITINDDDGVLIGSEGFGYSAFSHPFESLDLVPGALGVTTIRSTGNNNADLVTLPAGTTFNYYGTSYSSFYVSTNGLITFASSNTSASNSNLTSAPTQRSIAPLWDDWVNVSGQSMLLRRFDDANGDGSPERMVIEWNNVQGNTSSPSPLTFQAILQLNSGTSPGEITFNYSDLDAGNAVSNGGSATVGIKDTGTQGTRRLLISQNSATNPYIGSGKAIKIKPDAVPPTVSLTAPGSGDTVSGTVAIAATASDNISMAGVQFLLDSVNLGAEDTTAPYSVSWNSLTASAGQHVLTARARDSSGNLNSTSVTVTVVPQLNITAPSSGATVVGSTVNIAYATAGDLAGAGVDHVHFTLDGTTTLMDLSLDGVYQLTNVAPGNHTLAAIFARSNHTEIAGTQTATIPFTVTAPDTTAPEVSLTNPGDGAGVSGTVALAAAATDNVGVVGVQFLLDGVPLGAEDLAAPYSINWDTATATPGTHALAARARDSAGNVTTSAVITATVANGSTPDLVGQWSSVMNWPLVAMNTVLLKDGRVLMWDGGPDCIGSTTARVWNPATNTFIPVPLPYFTHQDDDIFCSAQALLADGRVLVVGGHDCDGPQLGIRMVNIFDPVSMTWTRGPDMQYRRWYPTATTLADGRVLVTAGSVNTTTDYVPYPEIYDPVTNSWTTLTAADQTIPNYPFVFQNVDGRVLAAGSDESPMATYSLNVATQTWTTVDNTVLDAGSGVMYRPGHVMKAGSSYLSAPADNGGGIPSKATAYVLDATATTPDWRAVDAMEFPRTHLNLTLLPDGNVLATGGSTDIGGVNPANAVYAAEVWSPETETWTTLASMQRPRLYHSTAVLLADGRVLVTGGGHNFFNSHAEFNAEIYSPAYLFRGPRPTITSAPSNLAYGGDFFVATPDSASIESVVLIRAGSSTHAFNMDQRFIPLTFSQSAGGLTIESPADANLAPPGHYLLFLVNSDGVPSIAPMVRFPAAYEDFDPPSTPMSLQSSGSLVTTSLSWSAATDNVAVTAYDVYRSTTPDFAIGPGNRIGETSLTSYVDTGLTAGTYYYRVAARDAAGNRSLSSNEATAVVTADTSSPVVSVTSPAAGATLAGSIVVAATASDDVAVAGVQFFLDGAPLGAEDLVAPFETTWNTGAVANGSHAITARARDTGGNLATSILVTVTVSNAIPSGLVLALGFNEGTGGAAMDASGVGNHGTLSGAAWSAAGRFGGAVSFDGVNDLVTVADAASLDLTTGMTLEAWVRPTTINGWETVLLKEAGTQLAYALYADNNGNDSGGPRRPGGWIRQGGTSYSTLGTSQLTVNQWSHLAATYDGSSLRLYVNGTLVSSVARTGSINVSTGALRIGGNNVWSEWFNGLIDEVRVYNRPLTAAEISADMNLAIGGDALGLASDDAQRAAESRLLTAQGLQPLISESIRRWELAGISAAQAQALTSLTFEIADLPGNQLGEYSLNRIVLDVDAAGYGWFLDPTPSNDAEFDLRSPDAAASLSVDALTVLLHEMGHALGHGHDDEGAMAETLNLGAREMPAESHDWALLELLISGDRKRFR